MSAHPCTSSFKNGLRGHKLLRAPIRTSQACLQGTGRSTSCRIWVTGSSIPFARNIASEPGRKTRRADKRRSLASRAFKSKTYHSSKDRGGQTVPRTIICRNTVKAYLIDYNSIFYALNTLPDLLRPAVICYSVVGRVVGRDRSSWLF